MIDHLTIRVRDFDASRNFYAAALKPLGYEVLRDFDIPGYGKICGLGVEGKPELWLAKASAEHPTPLGQHLALRARSRAEVNAFYAAALAAGARDDGAPGPRAQYHPSYYGAFVVDLNGLHLEACTHHAE
jgi:catechol 2,3-dioxygenase-like lactoylglutathione lyase family enzyme